MMAAAKTTRISFCSQLLCAPLYMVAQAGGFFKEEGLDIEIVNLRGSPAVDPGSCRWRHRIRRQHLRRCLDGGPARGVAYSFPFNGEATLVRPGGGTRARKRYNDSGKT
jgi:hypothetical protein